MDPKESEGQEPEEIQTDEGQTETFPREHVEELRKENAKRRADNKALAQQVEELTRFKQEIEDANKSEVEKLTSANKELEQKLVAEQAAVRETAIAASVKLEASKQGAVDPDAVYRLIDLSMIEFDDRGVKGVDKAVKALLKDKPYLVSNAEDTAPPPVPGAGGAPIKGAPDKSGFESAVLGTLRKRGFVHS